MTLNSDTEPYYFIGLPMSKPRILIPMAPKRFQALSFNLYNPGSSYGRILKYFGRMGASFGLMRLPGKLIAVPVERFKATEHIQPILNANVLLALKTAWAEVIGSKAVCFSLSLGEPNHYRKATALIFDKSAKPVAFAKVAGTDQAKALIANEAEALGKMNPSGCRSLAAPCLLGQGQTENIAWIMQTPLLAGRSSPNRLQKAHLDCLSEISQHSTQIKALGDDSLLRLLKAANQSPASRIKAEFESERGFVEKLYSLMKAQSLDEPWPFTIAHGDFAPWNMRLIDGRLGLFDWEYFMPVAPAGWDLFYFIFRVANLIKRQSLEQLWINFDAGAYRETISVFEQTAGLTITDKRFLAMMVLMAMAFDFPAKKIAIEAA